MAHYQEKLTMETRKRAMPDIGNKRMAAAIQVPVQDQQCSGSQSGNTVIAVMTVTIIAMVTIPVTIAVAIIASIVVVVACMPIFTTILITVKAVKAIVINVPAMMIVTAVMMTMLTAMATMVADRHLVAVAIAGMATMVILIQEGHT